MQLDDRQPLSLVDGKVVSFSSSTYALTAPIVSKRIGKKCVAWLCQLTTPSPLEPS